VNLLGFAVPVPAAVLAALAVTFWFGLPGALLFAAVAGVSHYAESRTSSSSGSSSNSSSSGRGGGGGGRPNIRGMKDLPQVPPSS
jgi:hypothetical protein